MNKIYSFVLAAVAGAMFVAAPAWAQSQDSTSYKSFTDKAAALYKSARAQCNADTGSARKVCIEEAKAARARAHADAVAQHKNTPKELSKARAAVANAEYGVARAKCVNMTAGDKDTCMRDAKSARTAALSDAKAGTQMAGAGMSTGASGTSAGDITSSGASSGASTSAGTGAGTAASEDQRNRSATGSARNAIGDTVITTKIKADMIKEPGLKAMDVHVETVNGVVMLSGFVPSETEAKKAVELARSVEGVKEVKSALKVK